MASRLVVSTYKNGNHRYSLDGEWVPGVTSLTHVLHKPALQTWYARQAATWAALNPEQLATLGHESFVATASKAPDRARDQAGSIGRTLHSHAETLVATGQVDVDEADLPLVVQAADFLDRMLAHPVASERAVFHDMFQYAGRLDLLADLNGSDGTWLLDFKTGASGVWPEMALQQAAYRFCTHMAALDAAGEDPPMPPVAHVGIVWVRPEGWQLIPLRADRDVWTTFLALIPLHQFSKRKRDAIVGAPMASGKAASHVA